MEKVGLIFSFILLNNIFFGCSSGGDSNDDVSTVALTISAPNLISPKNNEACLDGIVVNDTQSTLYFSWGASLNATNYKINIKNLTTQQNEQFSSTTTSKEVTLNSSEPYSWYVTAQGDPLSAPVDSQTWKFYLAGDKVINYAPFPPEILSPRSAATITPIDGEIVVQWNCIDVDNDLLKYEVFLDTVDGSTSIKNVNHESTTTETTLPVENSTTYYWKIIAEDSNGNKSSSGVYSFITS